MLPIVHVRATDTLAGRLGALLPALGDEALADRPGRSLVMDRLLEVMLVEALRYRPADMPGRERGLLAGLDDAKVGRLCESCTRTHSVHGRSRRCERCWNVAVRIRRSLHADHRHAADRSPRQLAMTLAKSALLSSNAPLAELAEIAGGYKSVSAFSTGFKRATGF